MCLDWLIQCSTVSTQTIFLDSIVLDVDLLLCFLRLPETVLFTEEPQMARWDHENNYWRLDGFSDFKYDEGNCFNPSLLFMLLLNSITNEHMFNNSASCCIRLISHLVIVGN